MFQWLRHAFDDSAYAGDELKGALEEQGTWTIEVVKRSDVAKGFVLLPRRWTVEHMLAWLNRNRRLAKNFDATIESSVTWLYMASIKLMSRRLAVAWTANVIGEIRRVASCQSDSSQTLSEVKKIA